MGNNWLDHQAQRVVVNGSYFNGSALQAGRVSYMWRGSGNQDMVNSNGIYGAFRSSAGQNPEFPAAILVLTCH